MFRRVTFKKWQSVVFLCSILLTGVAAPAAAQFETAVVLGTVNDASAAAVPGATITLTNLDTGIAASTLTDEHGSYQFLNVRIGRYQVSAELTGFSSAIAQDVVVTVNARRRVDLTLQLGTMTDQVTVTGGRQLLETDSSERGQVIEREQIVNLPLNGRSYSNLGAAVDRRPRVEPERRRHERS